MEDIEDAIERPFKIFTVLKREINEKFSMPTRFEGDVERLQNLSGARRYVLFFNFWGEIRFFIDFNCVWDVLFNYRVFEVY